MNKKEYIDILGNKNSILNLGKIDFLLNISVKFRVPSLPGYAFIGLPMLGQKLVVVGLFPGEIPGEN